MNKKNANATIDLTDPKLDTIIQNLTQISSTSHIFRQLPPTSENAHATARANEYVNGTTSQNVHPAAAANECANGTTSEKVHTTARGSEYANGTKPKNDDAIGSITIQYSATRCTAFDEHTTEVTNDDA